MSKCCAGDIPIRLRLLCLCRKTGVSLTPVGGESGALRLFPKLPKGILSPSSVVKLALSVAAACPTSPAFWSSSSTGAHAIMNTPMKVATHPYRNVTNWWNVAFFEVAVEDGRTEYCGEIEQDKLNRNDDFTIKAHQCSVEILDLRNTSENKDKENGIGEPLREHFDPLHSQ